MNAEAAARAKRERRKANEIKTRTIQRMQLQMTAPLDIGLEQQDLALRHGQSDIFELETEDMQLCKTLQTKLAADGEDGDILTSSEDEAVQGEDDRENGILDSEEEKEKKVAVLEADLDGMYEAYQGRLRERDAKYRIREAREKNGQREAWHGIKPQDSDDDSDDEEGEEEGGWDKVQAAKMRDDDNSSSDDSSTESDHEEKVRTSKRQVHFSQEADPREKKRRRISEPSKDARSASSGATALWFSQDVFGKVQGLNQLDDSEEDSDKDNETEDGSDDLTGEIFVSPFCDNTTGY